MMFCRSLTHHISWTIVVKHFRNLPSMSRCNQASAAAASSASFLSSSSSCHTCNNTNPAKCLSTTARINMADIKPAERVSGMTPSVWVEFTKLASETKAINLGQGFPDFAAPEHVVKGLNSVVQSTNPLTHQYTRGFGHPRLVNAIAALYGKHMGREINPMNEVLVPVGAYGSLFYIFMGLVSPGDEVIIIEPFFDCYEPMVKMAGGIPRFIALKPKTDKATSTRDFVLDPDELTSMFNDKTKAIVVNNPNNPLGKVFDREELKMIANLCKKHNVLCVSDEVYEYMVFDGHQHIRMASLPDMWHRTITVCSAGKIFSVTGWKLGWAIGPNNLLHSLMMVHQNCVYTCSTVLQEAVAVSLEKEMAMLGKPECYLTGLAEELNVKREKMASLLRDIDLTPIIPDGGYFIMTDISHLDVDVEKYGEGRKDFKFVRWMTHNLGVATIPCSAFYGENHKELGEKYIRFCFIKEDSTMEKAAERLKKWTSSLSK